MRNRSEGLIRETRKQTLKMEDTECLVCFIFEKVMNC